MNITLKSLMRKILKKWYIIVIVTLLCTLCGMVYANYSEKIAYKLTASANVYFEEKVIIEDGVPNEEIKKVAIGAEGIAHLNKLISSKTFNETLATNLKSKDITDVDYDNLPKYFNIAKDEGSEYLINFYATHENETTAEILLYQFQLVLNKFINEKPLYLGKFAKIDNFSESYNTDRINLGGGSKIIILLTFLGFCVSIVLVAIYVVLSNKLTNVDNFDDDFDLELLGSINFEIKKDKESVALDEKNKVKEIEGELDK